jgi:hypothetical protein
MNAATILERDDLTARSPPDAGQPRSVLVSEQEQAHSSSDIHHSNRMR